MNENISHDQHYWSISISSDRMLGCVFNVCLHLRIRLKPRTTDSQPPKNSAHWMSWVATRGVAQPRKKNNTPNSNSVILIMKSDKPRYIFFHDQQIKQRMWCNYQHDCNQGALKCLWPLLSKFWTTKSHRYILQDCSAQPQSQVWWWDTWHVKMASILRSKILRLKCRVALKM